jgi:glycosyltransferase involved in cell wall biosynthesis
MQQFGIRVPMKVVPNVVDPAVFKVKEKRAHRVYRFVHVSSLDTKQKNFHLLVRAFYALKKEQENVELHVVSDGNEKAYTQLLKDFDFASSIHFHGKQDPEGVAAILQFADAFVLSSRYENLPCVLIESLACGTPVISTQVGGVAEIVHSQNGLLVPSEDLNALINAMKQIQGMSFEGVDLQREMLLKFGPETISGLFLEAYQMLLKTDVA